MKKVLIVCSVSSMIEQFNLNNIRILKKLGYKVCVAANFKESGNIPNEKSKKVKEQLINDEIDVFDISFSRKPISYQNIKAYRQLRNILKNNNFTFIHAQSPIGGVLARLANSVFNKQSTKMIYTAHGFHFYKGGPLLNWIIYFPLEYMLSFLTDLLITINEEDFVQSQKLKSKNRIKIPGVGIDTSQFGEELINQDLVKEKLSIPSEGFVITSVGELNQNKNHIAIIEALKLLSNHKIYYLICGIGPQKDQLMGAIREYGLEENIQLLGYRTDIQEILSISNVFAFPSKREGLGLAAIEAMAVGLPIITSNVHGINDYSENGKTGYKIDPEDYEGFADAIKNVIELSPSDYDNMSKYNRKIAQEYDYKIVDSIMKDIYLEFGSSN